MKKTFLPVVGALVALAGAAMPGASGQVFYDDFEAGLSKWSVVSGATTLTVSTAQQIAPAGGAQSARMDSSLNRMYSNLAQEAAGQYKATFYIYDPVAPGATTSTRFYGEVRAYEGLGVGSGALEQMIAIGKNSSVNIGTFNGTKYQGRVLTVASGSAGFFNLDDPGAPDRSVGWHKFEIETSSTDSTVLFYVDGILSKTITNSMPKNWDSLAMGGPGLGSTASDVYFDGIQLAAVPEPAACALVAGLGLVGFAGWRRARAARG